MRSKGTATTVRVVAVRGASLALALVFAGCGGGRIPPVPASSPFFGNRSLPAHDAALRHYLTLRDSTILPQLLETGPRDVLVRQLQTGLFHHRLGRFRESNVALQEAERLALERYTKRISQNVAAFIVSDNVLDFYPSAQEWSMIHYYRMMNYLQLGDVENALVQARRANALVRRYANDNPGRTFTNPAAIQYIAGMLQWSAGDDNDAVVSLRTALGAFEEQRAAYGVAPPAPVVDDLIRFADQRGFPEVAEATRARYRSETVAASERRPAADTGELMVLIENGFVAHRAPEKLYIPVLRSEKDSVLGGDAGSAVFAAVKVLIRTVIVMNELSARGADYPAHEDGVIIATVGSAVGLELLTLAWPSYRTDARRAARIEVSAGGTTSTPVLLQDLSTIEVRDFEERKPTIMLRMVARGLLKEAGVTAAEAAGEKAGGSLGGFVGRVASRALATATERADTRTWSTLPAELLLARFRLPAGRHAVTIAYDGWQGRRESTELTVDIQAGRITTHTIPLLGSTEGDTERLRSARYGVRHRAPPAQNPQRSN